MFNSTANNSNTGRSMDLILDGSLDLTRSSIVHGSDLLIPEREQQ